MSIENYDFADRDDLIAEIQRLEQEHEAADVAAGEAQEAMLEKVVVDRAKYEAMEKAIRDAYDSFGSECTGLHDDSCHRCRAINGLKAHLTPEPVAVEDDE